MRKFYYAYVDADMVDYFEEKLSERKDNIDIIKKDAVVTGNREICMYYYKLKAEEGIINPKWELTIN